MVKSPEKPPMPSPEKPGELKKKIKKKEGEKPEEKEGVIETKEEIKEEKKELERKTEGEKEEIKIEEIKEKVEELKKEEILRNLEEKRKIFVEKEKEFKDFKKREKLGLTEKEREFQKVKLEYEKAKAQFLRINYQEKIKELEALGITKEDPRFKEEMALFEAALAEDTIREGDILMKERLEKIDSLTVRSLKKLWTNYAQMPMWKKMAISTTIATGLAAAGVLPGVVIGGVGGAVLFGTQRFIRGMLLGKIATLAGGFVIIRKSRRTEEWFQREIENYKKNFAIDIEKLTSEKEWEIFARERNKMCEEILRERNKKYKNAVNWGIGAAVLVGGLAVGTQFALNGPLGDYLSQKLGFTEIAKPGIPETPPKPGITPPGAEAGKPEEAPVKAIPEEAPKPKITPLTEAVKLEPKIIEIGERGPEGAIIDYFKANPEVAKSFGWDGKVDLTEWSGKTAHLLWLKEAKEVLARPETLEQLKKLGYSPDLEGYAQMMRRIAKGFVELDPKTKEINLVDMEYLKARVPPSEVVTPKPVPEAPVEAPVTEEEVITKKVIPETLPPEILPEEVPPEAPPPETIKPELEVPEIVSDIDRLIEEYGEKDFIEILLKTGAITPKQFAEWYTHKLDIPLNEEFINNLKKIIEGLSSESETEWLKSNRVIHSMIERARALEY